MRRKYQLQTSLPKEVNSICSNENLAGTNLLFGGDLDKALRAARESSKLGANKHGDHRDLHSTSRRQRQMCIRDRSMPAAAAQTIFYTLTDLQSDFLAPESSKPLSSSFDLSTGGFSSWQFSGGEYLLSLSFTLLLRESNCESPSSDSSEFFGYSRSLSFSHF